MASIVLTAIANSLVCQHRLPGTVEKVVASISLPLGDKH